MQAALYPALGILFQAIGMVLVGLECALRFPRPDLLLDTSGVAFAYPVFWLAGTPIVAYVHYPLLYEPATSEGGLKAAYHRVLTRVYALCGRLVSKAICNSTWTFDRIVPLWEDTRVKARVARKMGEGEGGEGDKAADANVDTDATAEADAHAIGSGRVSILYPPCDLDRLREFDVGGEREPILFSLGQFRPEKNQSLQLDILQCLLARRPEWRDRIHLAIYGGCRNASDRARADALMQRAVSLRLATCVSVVTDVDYQAILEMLQEATIGLHTMAEEHFGINIVEFMAAGPIAVAHASGGPITDVIREPGITGFLAHSVEEYAETIERILAMPEAGRREIREAARKSALARFDGTIFANKFSALLQPFLSPPSK